MSDDNGHAPPGTPAAQPSDLHARHRHEVAELRAVIAELLQQVEFLQAPKPRADAAPAASPAQRDLVLAAFGAQHRQIDAGAEADAEAAILRQTEFLSMLAHELRNPLQPIAMANELLGKVAAAARTWRATSASSAAR